MAAEPDTAEFDCADCGLHVIRVMPLAWPIGYRRVCGGCGWLRDLRCDAIERARTRKWMVEREIIGGGNDEGR